MWQVRLVIGWRLPRSRIFVRRQARPVGGSFLVRGLHLGEERLTNRTFLAS